MQLNTNQSQSLQHFAGLPPSLIPEQYHQYDKSPLLPTLQSHADFKGIKYS